MANTEQPAEKATPLPWEVRETKSGDPYIASGVFILIDRFYVTRDSERERAEERRANAELIVRSVNQSAGVEGLVTVLGGFIARCPNCFDKNCTDLLHEEARAALAAVEQLKGEG